VAAAGPEKSSSAPADRIWKNGRKWKLGRVLRPHIGPATKNFKLFEKLFDTADSVLYTRIYTALVPVTRSLGLTTRRIAQPCLAQSPALLLLIATLMLAPAATAAPVDITYPATNLD
jgi:hypothetical protein